MPGMRGTEVVSDSTNVMALECARRLRKSPSVPVRLATCQRVVRAQAIPKKPGYAHHFKLFAMATAIPYMGAAAMAGFAFAL